MGGLRKKAGGPMKALLMCFIVFSAFASASVLAQKKITLEEFVIEGNIQKPEAFFILPRTNLNFEDLERREDLKKRIIQSVESAPF